MTSLNALGSAPMVGMDQIPIRTVSRRSERSLDRVSLILGLRRGVMYASLN